MGKSTFSGPLRTGRRHLAHATTYGHVMAAQKVGISGGPAGGDETHTHVFAERLPACDIVGIKAIVQTTFGATAASVVHLKVGTTSEASAFGQMLLLSPGVYELGNIDTSAVIFENTGSALAQWVGITEGTQIVVTISAAVTATLSGRGVVYLSYYQNSAATV